MLAQRLGGFAYFALAGKEHQYIAAADAGQLVDRIGYGLHQRAVIDIVSALRVNQRPIAQLDRIQPTRDFDDRRRAACIGKVLRKARRRRSSPT